MEWLKKNLTVRDIVVIAVIIAGWISTAAIVTYRVDLYGSQIKNNKRLLDGVTYGDIPKNTAFRKQGHSFSSEDRKHLNMSYQHAQDKNIHIDPKHPNYVPIDLYKSDMEQIRKYQERFDVKLDRILERLAEK